MTRRSTFVVTAGVMTRFWFGEMLFGLLGILASQLLGEVVSYELSLPVPGPVLGMMIMFVALLLIGRGEGNRQAVAAKSVSESGDAILRNMSLLFVPAGVGVVQKLDLLTSFGFGLLVTVIISTIATLLVTVLTFIACSRATTRA